MRIISKFIAMAGLALFGLSQQVSAAVLYDNGPLSNDPGAAWIYSVYVTADSFTLSQASIVTGVTFGVWYIPGDTLFSVDFGITNTRYTYADNGAASVTLVPAFSSLPNSPGVNGASSEGTASISTGSIALAAGTYYLVLSNAVTAFDSALYLDSNNGPSISYQCNTAVSSCGDASVGSNSFQIIGNVVTPLPSTWLMLLSGFVGLGFFAYGGTKKNSAAIAVA